MFSKVAVGKEHIAAITKDRRLFTMGTEDHGKLGHDPKVVSEEEAKLEAERYKKAGYKPGSQERQAASIGYVKGAIEGKAIVAVDCGEAHTVCVTDGGEVFSWGRGKFGALGHEATVDVSQPKKVEGLSDIVDVKCGGDYTLVKDKNGKLYAFGDNSYG